MEKHGDTEITWNGNADNYNSLDNVQRIDGETLKFTWDEVLTKKTELIAEHNAQEYVRSRKTDYPEIGDQLDALYHAGVFPANMAARIKETKDKYPK